MRSKRRKKFSAVRLSLFSQDPQWENFSQDLEEAPFLRFIGNSFFKAIVIMLVQLFLSSSLAYALSHMWFRGRETLFWVVLSTYMLPTKATYVPRCLIVARMGLVGFACRYYCFQSGQWFYDFFIATNLSESSQRVDRCDPC